MEALTTHMQLLTEHLTVVASQTYTSGGMSTSKSATDALERFGVAMRDALAVEEISTRLEGLAFGTPKSCTSDADCAEFDPATCNVPNANQPGTCELSGWSKRWNQARSAYLAARVAATQAAVELRHGKNPLGIQDDDIPLFFGDLTGTNSRFFASSDYLMNTWAVSAVASARGALNDARDAWLKQRDSKIQDQVNSNDKIRRLDAISDQYGKIIGDACGFPDTVPSSDLLDQAIAGKISFTQCDVDTSKPECNRVIQAPDESTAIDTAIQTCLENLNMNASTVDSIKQDLCYRLLTEFPETQMQNITYAAHYDPNGTGYATAGDHVWNPDTNMWQTYQYSSCSDNGPILDFFGITGSICIGPLVTVEPCNNEIFGLDKIQIVNLDGPTGTAARDYCQTHVKATYMRDVSVSPRADGCYRGDIGVAESKLNRAKQDVDEANIGLQDLVTNYDNASIACIKLSNDENVVSTELSNFEQVANDLDLSLAAAQAVKEAHADSYKPFYTFASNPTAFGFEAALVQSFDSQQQEEDTAAINQLKTALDAATRAHDGFLREVSGIEAVAECMQKAESIWVGFDAARGLVTSRLTDQSTAQSELNDAITKGQRAVTDGKAALDRENSLTVGTYSYHYWFDEKVTRFRREFEWAKRLVYLSLRAVEYEFQQSLPLRNAILSADHPDQLEAALQELQTELATRTIGRRRPEQASVVLSLRDDILKIPDRTTATNGERAMSPSLTFRTRLWDDKFAVRDENGKWMGQGIPFTFTPQGALTNRCAERLWRVTATIQGDGLSDTEPGATVALLKRNTFASQWCDDRGANQPTSLQVASVQPSRNLFRDSQPATTDETRSLTAASIYPWFNVRRSDFFKASYQDGASEELAGRGLYGDYVLLFPRELLEGPDGPAPATGDPGSGPRTEVFPLSHVEDVLLRFDYLSVDNLPAVAQ
jgi:hypothetical protein